MLTYHNDNSLKFDYNPQLHSTISNINAVGPTIYSGTVRTLDITPSNDNCIYISKAGDDTWDGTQETPVLTIEHAITLCDATHQCVCIADSGVYVTKPFAFAGNFLMLIALLGCTPEICINEDPLQKVEEPLVTDTTFIGNASYGHNDTKMLFHDDKILVLYMGSDTNSYYLCYAVLDASSLATLQGPDILLAVRANNYGFNAKVMDDGNILITSSSGTVVTYFQYAIFNPDTYEVIKSATTIAFTNNVDYDGSAAILPNGNFVIFYTKIPDAAYSKLYYKIYSKTNYEVLQEETLLYTWTVGSSATGAAKYITADTLPDGNIIVAYNHVGDSDKGKYILVNSTTFDITEPTTFADVDMTATYGRPFDFSILPDGTIYFIYTKASNSYIYRTIIDSTDYSTIKSEEQLLADASLGVSVSHLIDNRIIVFRKNYSGNAGSINYFVNILTSTAITVSSSASINGITLTSSDEVDTYYKDYINATAALDIKWCEISGNKSASAITRTQTINTTSSLDIANSVITDNDKGVLVSSNDVDISYSQFTRILLGYALDITGVGASVNHCDFVRNYGGIKLTDNDGSEVIKNSIFYVQSLFAIEAEEPITYNNCVNTSSTLNATAGLAVINANPHYVNDGSLDPDDIDLNLKRKEIGYRYTSPAIILADDGKNSGSLDVTLTDIYQTWTSIEVDKGQFKVTIEPVGDVKVDYKDGSTATYRDSYKEVLEITWTALSNADFAKLQGLYYCDNPTVRIYPDPITYPNAFNTYTLVYDKVNASTKHNKLTRTGISDFSLTFERAYNEGA